MYWGIIIPIIIYMLDAIFTSSQKDVKACFLKVSSRSWAQPKAPPAPLLPLHPKLTSLAVVSCFYPLMVQESNTADKSLLEMPSSGCCNLCPQWSSSQYTNVQCIITAGCGWVKNLRSATYFNTTHKAGVFLFFLVKFLWKSFKWTNTRMTNTNTTPNPVMRGHT